MSDREATNELSSSVHEGAGYNKIYPSGHEPKEDFPRSPERNRLPIPSTMMKRMKRKRMRETSMEMSMMREIRMQKTRWMRKMRRTNLKE